jgi:hypothetical protein
MGAYALAIVRAALADADGPPQPAVEAEAYAFVERQLARLPDVLKLPVRAAGRAIDVLSLSTYRKQFTALSLPEQRYILALGRSSTVRAVRDAIRFYESLAFFVRAGMESP